MNTKHSALPWQVRGNAIRNLDCLSAGCAPLAEVKGDDANAAFIVIACNSFHYHVDLLQQVKTWIDENSIVVPQELHCALEIAIRKAGAA